MKINQKLNIPGGVEQELTKPAPTDARREGGFRNALEKSAIEPQGGSSKPPVEPRGGSGAPAESQASVAAAIERQAASAKAPPNPAPAPSQQPAARNAVGDRAEVPDSWKHPAGPYHQAPAEYGGGWWYVSPFTGAEPWKRLDAVNNPSAGGVGGAGAANQLPDGFAEVFGEKPMGPQYKNYREYQTAKIRWEQDLKYFKQAGVPPEVTPEKLEAITKTAEAWGMGAPKFYEGRYGWKVRFPDSAFPDHEVGLEGVTMGMHQSIARYQVRLVEAGIEPAQKHPFVPPWVWMQLNPSE